MQYLFIFYLFIIGTIIGSFLNCLIWRIHKNQGMMNRSYCPQCKKQIAWYDNIPVISFFLLGGKCRHCKKKISWQYPTVEFITGILFVLAWNKNAIDFYNPDYIMLLRDLFIICIMIIVFIYDLRWYLILDKITLPACLLILILNLSLGMSWQALFFSAIIGSSFFLVQFLVSGGKWIGGGDIRLGLLMGIIFAEWSYLLLSLFLAYLLGSIFGIGLILLGKKKWSSKLPLGVFLSTSTIFCLFWGEQILNWYLNFF